MITIRRARLSDAVAIAAVHVAAWRSAYPGILPDAYLARLSVPRQAGHYERAIRAGTGVHVATVSGMDLGAEGGRRALWGLRRVGRRGLWRRRRRWGRGRSRRCMCWMTGGIGASGGG